MLQFLQEGQHPLFHSPLAVLDVCRPLFDIVCSDFGLPVLFCSPSAPLRQIEGLHEGRISGSS
jgi:hypothetical protein